MLVIYEMYWQGQPSRDVPEPDLELGSSNILYYPVTSGSTEIQQIPDIRIRPFRRFLGSIER